MENNAEVCKCDPLYTVNGHCPYCGFYYTDKKPIKKKEETTFKKTTMDKQQLFEKYNVDESHNQWGSIDDWMSVEIYRIMHDGNLPPQEGVSVGWVCDFLDKKDNMKWWVKNVMSRKDWGSLYLTAKRMVYSMADEILKERA